MLAQILSVVQWLAGHYVEIIAAVSAALTGMIAVALLIPGPQPEGYLQAIVDFLAKFSKK